MESSLPSRYRLRILTQNLWHGLDHTNPYVMWPAENFAVGWHRTQAQKTGLRALLETDANPEQVLQVFCLQEINPLNRKLKNLKKDLSMEGVGVPINVGIRAGEISYPLFLQDGVGILWKGGLKNPQSESRILSGSASEWKTPAPLSIPVTLQLAERRGAILVSGEWAGKTFTFANLHLHNGSPAKKECSTRRSREVDTLMEWMDPWIQKSDATFISGDFNCEHGHAELSPLISAGFEEVLTALGEPIATWDPKINPIAGASLSKSDAQDREWDSKAHQIDHIFYKAKGKSWGKREDSRPPWTFRVERVFDKPILGAWASDHFGLMAEISWTV